MKVVLLIRRTKPYYEQGIISIDHLVPDKAKVLAAIDAWPFKIPYLQFRKELDRIAAITRNGFDEIIPWQDSEAVARLERGTWLVPVDEDDWLAPHFISAVRNYITEPGRKYLTWDVYRKKADGGRLKNTFVESCGYGLELPYSHWQDVTNHMRIKSVSPIPSILAVRNETVASLGVMMYRPGTDLVETLKKAMMLMPSDMPKEFKRQYDLYQNLLAEAVE